MRRVPAVRRLGRVEQAHQRGAALAPGREAQQVVGQRRPALRIVRGQFLLGQAPVERGREGFGIGLAGLAGELADGGEDRLKQGSVSRARCAARAAVGFRTHGPGPRNRDFRKRKPAAGTTGAGKPHGHRRHRQGDADPEAGPGGGEARETGAGPARADPRGRPCAREGPWPGRSRQRRPKAALWKERVRTGGGNRRRRRVPALRPATRRLVPPLATPCPAPPGDALDQRRPVSLRAITRRWISLVPS